MANIGYYDLLAGQGNNTTGSPEAAILAAGHTPVQIFSLTPAELGTLEVLFILNSSTNTDYTDYATEYLLALPNIQAAVESGMQLVISDQAIGANTASILPGLPSGVTFTASPVNDVDLTFNGFPVLTNGLGGPIDSASLDSGPGAPVVANGYVDISGTAPGTVFSELHVEGQPAQNVSISYTLGTNGAFVSYTSLRLDAFLTNGTDAAVNPALTANMQAFTTNYLLYSTIEGFTKAPAFLNSLALDAPSGDTHIAIIEGFDFDNDPLSFSITGGLDASLFAINANSGQLTFITPQDFNAPNDNGTDGIYNVEIGVADGTHSTRQDFVVTLNDGAVSNSSPQAPDDVVFSGLNENSTVFLLLSDFGYANASALDPDFENNNADVTFTFVRQDTGTISTFRGDQFGTFGLGVGFEGTNVIDVYVEDGNENGSTPTPSTLTFNVTSNTGQSARRLILMAQMAMGQSFRFNLFPVVLVWTSPLATPRSPTMVLLSRSV